jgi:hypothetical protein
MWEQCKSVLACIKGAFDGVVNELFIQTISCLDYLHVYNNGSLLSKMRHNAH